MPKRKERNDPDSSDEDVAQRDQSAKGAKRKVKRDDGQASDAGPFDYHARPTEAEARAARDSLARLHGEPTRPGFVSDSTGKTKKSILDSLVQTILSQNTTDTNSHKTFANLKADFKDWDDVRRAPSAKVEASIKLGGLAAIKTERIKSILDSTIADNGSCTLEHLRSKSDEEIKEELLKYNGVGPKTAACVLMFAMGRFEFPVDTHVWRISKSLGWVPNKANREDTYEHLNTRIPDDIKYDLHVLLVEHGKRCVRCSKNGRPRKEQHGPCPLANLAAAAKAGQKLSAKKAVEDAEQSLKEEEGSPAGVEVKDEEDAAEAVKEEEDEEIKTEEDDTVKQEEDGVKKEEKMSPEYPEKLGPVKKRGKAAVKKEPSIKEEPRSPEVDYGTRKENAEPSIKQEPKSPKAKRSTRQKKTN